MFCFLFSREIKKAVRSQELGTLGRTGMGRGCHAQREPKRAGVSPPRMSLPVPAPNVALTTPAEAHPQVWKGPLCIAWPTHGKSPQLLKGGRPTERMCRCQRTALRAPPAQPGHLPSAFASSPQLGLLTHGHRSPHSGGRQDQSTQLGRRAQQRHMPKIRHSSWHLKTSE